MTPATQRSRAGGPLTVLYVAGWTRSGTTLLGNILNEVESCFNAGEVRYLWRDTVLDDRRRRSCGCGLHPCGCPVWRRVLDAELDRGVSIASLAGEMPAAFRRRFRTRHTWRVLRGHPDAEYARDIRVMAAVYRAIQAATGARVIVDTSKYPSGAAALFRMDGITPRVLHMVRDPRAVAFSWRRSKGDLAQMHPLTSTWHWLRFNVAADAVRRRWPDQSMLLRYEDLAADPQAAVARVLELAGRPAGTSPVHGRCVTLGANHTIHGNPDRFQTGEVRIAEDDEWRTRIPAVMAAAVTLVAAPVLRRYGYSVARSPLDLDTAPRSHHREPVAGGGDRAVRR